MSLHTNLLGRLRNTNLPKSHGLLPVFEAVINSIHSLEEMGNISTSGQITINIVRNGQSRLNLNDKNYSEISGFSISDNGVGFNDKNLASFETLDSDHKISKGCRGVGRLLWLKAFDKVEITSCFPQIDEKNKSRKISFNAKDGVKLTDEGNITDSQNTITTVELVGFDTEYRNASPKNLQSIANALLEHCLWYFVRPNGAPMILIVDQDESINLSELYDSYMHSSASVESLTIKNQAFDLTHIKFRASSNKRHTLSLCAASRLVKEESINGKIPGLYGKISDSSGEFVYCCYVTSKYLDDHVRPERTSFDIAEDVDDIFSNSEISLKEIREQVLSRSQNYLSEYLRSNILAGKERINDFVSSKAPKYRTIIPHINLEDLIIDPNITDKDLELHLHKQLAEIEHKILIEGQEIMTPESTESLDNYQSRLNKYLTTVEDIKKSDLASYISHRKVVLDLLEKYIQKDNDNKYAREDLIHNLIMPMRKDSNEITNELCNLWLIDERLAFHNYLASDKSLKSMPITGDNSSKEPDLCALNVYDNPLLLSEKSSLPLASITVVEIKRPMRNDAKSGEDKNPIEQALGYLHRIRQGKTQTSSGRPIPNSEDIPGYCYVICDLTTSIIERCDLLDLTITSDHMGFFGFHKKYNAYIEVISFDRLVSAAKERNRAFFDKLGLPIT